MKLAALVFLISAFFNTVVARASTYPFTISAAPQTPILIVTGSETIVDGTAVPAPYFVLNSLTLSWTGNGIANVVSVFLKSADSTVECAFNANDLKDMFPDAVSKRGNVVILSGQTITSHPFGCGSVKVANPASTSFNIPVTIESVAIITGGDNGDLQKIRATTQIVIQ